MEYVNKNIRMRKDLFDEVIRLGETENRKFGNMVETIVKRYIERIKVERIKTL